MSKSKVDNENVRVIRDEDNNRYVIEVKLFDTRRSIGLARHYTWEVAAEVDSDVLMIRAQHDILHKALYRLCLATHGIEDR